MDTDVSLQKNPLLAGLGHRVRLLRARRGMPRRLLAVAADVSERHLANLESGVGNVSVLVLDQVARALDCSLAELLGDETTSSPEWLMIRHLLHGRDAADLAAAHKQLSCLCAAPPRAGSRMQRIALIGLRGAGKSTLGARMGQALGRPFIELGNEITRLAGCSPAEIQALYGPNAYRRYEAQALGEVLGAHQACVIATAGGLVSEPATLDLLLTNCFTIWLQASPQEHMDRVIAQGDLRPMAGTSEAMTDLKLILQSRAAFHAKADATFDTSGLSVAAAAEGLLALITSQTASAG
jgi:XRE family aerobic/anaerobic benzoate catabolism transcriptional regulator